MNIKNSFIYAKSFQYNAAGHKKIVKIFTTTFDILESGFRSTSVFMSINKNWEDTDIIDMSLALEYI